MKLNHYSIYFAYNESAKVNFSKIWMIIKNSSVDIRKENVPKLTPVANLEYVSEKVNSLNEDGLNEQDEMDGIGNIYIPSYFLYNF